MMTIINRLLAKVHTPSAHSEAQPCMPTGATTPLFPGAVATTGTPVRLRFDRSAAKQKAALDKALLASAREAVANGQAESELAYMPELATYDYTDDETRDEEQELVARVRSALCASCLCPSGSSMAQLCALCSVP